MRAVDAESREEGQRGRRRRTGRRGWRAKEPTAPTRLRLRLYFRLRLRLALPGFGRPDGPALCTQQLRQLGLHLAARVASVHARRRVDVRAPDGGLALAARQRAQLDALPHAGGGSGGVGRGVQ